MRIFILGGGATGGLLAQLLRRQGHRVRCGDRSPERALPFLGRRMTCVEVNARYHRSIRRAAEGCQLLVNAAPAVFNESAIRAALRLKVHYLDMASHLCRDPFRAEQLEYAEAFERRGRLALINAGVAPGLTNLLVARCARLLDAVDRAHVRLFEDTESEVPVSTWSAEVAHDEAVSLPRVYRRGRFRLARRFSGAEWFDFPNPIGRARVVLAAQDEVATLPRCIPMRHMDVKIGGNEMLRLRRWFRQGRLRTSDDRAERRFPDTATPAEVAELIRRGKLRNARFALAVSVVGEKGGRCLELRRDCLFPTLRKLRSMRLVATPIAFAAAQSAAAFVENLPRGMAGAIPPEELPPETAAAVIESLRRRGFRFRRRTAVVEK